MAIKTKNVPDTRPDWQKDLDQLGFWRKLFVSRRWYGADWWFAIISAIILLFIFSLGIFPGLYAPYDPRLEAGAPLLAPGEVPSSYVIVSKPDDITSLDQLTRDVTFGIIRGDQSAQMLSDSLSTRQAELEAAGEEAKLRPRYERFDTIAQAMEALYAGEIRATIGLSSEIEELLEGHPEYAITLNVSGFTGEAHVLGTNTLGQDVFSRVIWGTRIALFVGFAAAVFAMLIGVPLGLIAGFWSGRLEKVLTLVMDSLYSFPGLILAIAITSVLGPGVLNVIVAIATLYIPTYYRIVRGQTMSVKEELYVEAAESLGVRNFGILIRYILPNVLPSILVIFSVNVADSIMTEAGLSFLGLGLPPDTPDWGIDLAAGAKMIRQAWWLVTFPGLMIVIVTLGFSMFGESLSEILNPKLSEN